MADGGTDRPPYRTVLAVGSWAWANRGYIEGRITLAGGDPDLLSLRQFVDVGFTVLVEEYQRLGVDLLSAIDKVGALGGEPEPEPDEVAVKNQQSMEALMGMLGGVKGAPV